MEVQRCVKDNQVKDKKIYFFLSFLPFHIFRLFLSLVLKDILLIFGLNILCDYDVDRGNVFFVHFSSSEYYFRGN